MIRICVKITFMKNEVIKKLIEAGYKITAPRLAVISYLDLKKQPISAKEIAQKIKNADQASVYRTLKTLEELQLINSEIVNREKLYCLDTEKHHHIICIKCGYIEKIACGHHFDNFKNFSQVTHQLTLNGICGKCNNKK